MAISRNGSWIFVLTDQGKILIYSSKGSLDSTIDIGNHVDQIKAGPVDELLIVKSSKNKTVQLLALDFVKTIDISGAPFKGPADAPVVIAVFSEFQWVYCKKLVPLLEQVLDTYPDKVKIVYKNFPLQRHKYARNAAIAALAADRQGKFWEFHDLLFENYQKPDDPKIKEIAQQLKLDLKAFENDLKNPEIEAKVQRDFLDGQKAEVRGTPTIFVNGRMLKNRSLQGFQTLIDKELTK